MKRLIFIALFALCASCEKKTPAQRPLPEVTTFTATAQTVPATYEYVGVAQSSHLVEIRSRVEGYLEQIAFKEGAVVRRGDLLYTLDLRPFEAALENTQAILAEQEAILWNARKTTARLKPLYEQNAVSQRDLDRAIAEELASEASVAAAKAKRREAELNLSYAVIRSPIDGLSSQSNYREGALITPIGSSNLLTTISIVDPIWINFTVSDSDILRSYQDVVEKKLTYPPDMNFEVEAFLSDGSPFPYKGRVDFADFSLNQNTGTMMVRAIFPNTNHLLRPGQFVRVQVKGAERPHAITVPQVCVMQGKGGMFLYIVKEKRVEIRQVTVGEWYNKEWIIKEGLSEGEKVIVEGINKVRPGQLVIEKSAGTK